MTSPDRVFLVRHCEYDSHTGNLTYNGYNEAAGIASTLAARSLGENALILSSQAPRAQQTAITLGGSFEHESTLVSSQRLEIASRPGLADGVESLDALLANCLRDAEVVRSPGQPLVVVSHDPLFYAGGFTLSCGEVAEYAPGSWQRTRPTRSASRHLNEELARRGLSLYEP